MIFTKREFESDPAFGKKPNERSVDELLDIGVVVIDKPCGPSSHEVSAWTKRIISTEKTGHSGTLDPRVSGVLPIGLNRSTKAMFYMAQSAKEYVCIIRFHRKIPEKRVREVLKNFVGEITQTPPLRSAVAKRPRKRNIYYLKPLEFNPPEVLFLVGCQAGTYIRKLCSDAGRLVGCGAHMEELRRTKAGIFSEKDSHTLQDLSDAHWLWKESGEEEAIREYIVPLERAIQLKKVWVSDPTVEALCSGAQLAAPGVSMVEKGFENGDAVAVLTLKGEIISFGKALVDWKKALSMEKGIVVSTDRVMMKKGTYPKCW
ncbi:MAG: RNA-guided pseudouridylation complex pseudouridine synthase subunit Cbf5 [Candidatus Micrarchaeota archaeon]